MYRRYITRVVDLPNGESIKSNNLDVYSDQIMSEMDSEYSTRRGYISKFGSSTIEDIDNKKYQCLTNQDVQECSLISLPDIIINAMGIYSDRIFSKDNQRLCIREITLPSNRLSRIFVESDTCNISSDLLSFAQDLVKDIRSLDDITNDINQLTL